jgi:hypothetical protein
MIPLSLLLGNPSDISPDADDVAIIYLSTHVLTTLDGSSILDPKVDEQLVIGTTLTNEDNVFDWATVDPLLR